MICGQVCFVDPRPFVDAVTSVKPDPFRGYPIERGIRRFYINFRTLPLLLFIKTRINKNVWQEWIVHLKQNAGRNDCAIFLVDLAGESIKVLFFGLVVLVDAHARRRCRRQRLDRPECRPL